MKAKFCDLCGKETHTRSRVLRYTEEFLRVNSDTHAYDVCDECSRKIDEAKNEAEFNTVKSIRDDYLAGKDVVIPDDSENPSESPSEENPSESPSVEDNGSDNNSNSEVSPDEATEETPSESASDPTEEKIGE